MLDPDGLVTRWNLGAQPIKGYMPEEIAGRHFAGLALLAKPFGQTRSAEAIANAIGTNVPASPHSRDQRIVSDSAG